MFVQRNALESRWTKFFMGIAENAKELSYSIEKKIGAVIVDMSTCQIKSYGYNGMPSGNPVPMEKIVDKKVIRSPFAIGAVANAIMRADMNSGIYSPCVLFCTDMPTESEAPLIANSSIEYVVVPERTESGVGGMLALEELAVTVFTVSELVENVTSEERIAEHITEQNLQLLQKWQAESEQVDNVETTQETETDLK